MLEPVNAWTKRMCLTALPLFVTGCATVQSNAICDGSSAARDAHTTALIADGGDLSVVTGARLLAMLDAACTERG